MSIRLLISWVNNTSMLHNKAEVCVKSEKHFLKDDIKLSLTDKK